MLVVRSLSAHRFLCRLFFTRARFGVLWTRGGLGNQLFQISALSFFSNNKEFSPIIHPCNLRKARDGFNPQYRSLGIEGLFSIGKRKVDPSLPLELILRVIYRVFSTFFRFAIYNESKMIHSSISSMPKLFFIQDYFQSQDYPNCLSEESLDYLVKDIPDSALKRDSSGKFPNQISAMIHVRLTDSHDKTNNRNRFLKAEKLVKNIDGVKGISVLDIYSDDLPQARELLEDIFVSTPKHYPEESEQLSPTALLGRFMQYDCIIASKSTLNWWACYLRSRLSTKESLILADFDQKLMRRGWLQIE